MKMMKASSFIPSATYLLPPKEKPGELLEAAILQTWGWNEIPNLIFWI